MLYYSIYCLALFMVLALGYFSLVIGLGLIFKYRGIDTNTALQYAFEIMLLIAVAQITYLW